MPDPDPVTVAFYQSIGTVELETLRAAFVADKAHGADARFVDGRVALIDRILDERQNQKQPQP